jgi:ABC-type transport system substrate-binding protein
MHVKKPEKYIFKKLSICIPLVLLSFLSCSSQNRLEGHVYYRLANNPTTLDPALIVDVPGGYISAKIFNGLVRLDENLNVIPDIAEKWEICDNGKTYVFHIKHGVFFSNKREVIAYDFKYSFKRNLSPEGRFPNTWVFSRILGAKDYMNKKKNDVAGIEVLDRYTLRIRLEEQFSPFINLLTMIPAYVVPREEVEKAGADFSSYPVGTGPFILKEWKQGNELILSRNEGYFSDKAKAKVKGIVYRIIPEDLTAVTEFEIGNLDLLGIPVSEYSRFKNSPKWKNMISSVNGLNTYYLGFNCSRPPFDNVRLRKAVSSAIDRDKILKTFYEGRGRAAKGPVPDILRKWDLPSVQVYDPATARRIIDVEGIKGKTVNFYVTQGEEQLDIAEIIQSYLNSAGLNVKIKQLEWSAYKSAINHGEADIFWLSWWADYPDPENFLFPLFHSTNHGAGGNRTMYTSKEADRLIEAGRRTLLPEDRNRYFRMAEEIIIQDAPWIFFWHKTDFTLSQPNLKNYKAYPIYSMDKGIEVSF